MRTPGALNDLILAHMSPRVVPGQAARLGSIELLYSTLPRNKVCGSIRIKKQVVGPKVFSEVMEIGTGVAANRASNTHEDDGMLILFSHRLRDEVKKDGLETPVLPGFV